MRYFWLISVYVLLIASCTMRRYRPEITGVVYDICTKSPIAGATVEFIQDTMTLGSTFGSINMNLGESYVTDINGIFKIEGIKDKHMRDSPYTSYYSTLFKVSHENYLSDTITFRKVPISVPKHTLDTIWLIKRTIK